MHKLSELKARMETLIVRYQNREFSLWDFALLQVYPHSLSVAQIPEGEKRNNNLSNLIQSISVIEGEMIKIVDENPDRKA